MGGDRNLKKENQRKADKKTGREENKTACGRLWKGQR